MGFWLGGYVSMYVARLIFKTSQVLNHRVVSSVIFKMSPLENHRVVSSLSSVIFKMLPLENIVMLLSEFRYCFPCSCPMSLFIFYMSPFQGNVACRNLTGPL